MLYLEKVSLKVVVTGHVGLKPVYDYQDNSFAQGNMLTLSHHASRPAGTAAGVDRSSPTEVVAVHT